MTDSMAEYDGYPALQICGAFGSITIRGSLVEVARTLRDMRDSEDPVIKGALAAVEKNVSDLASGRVGGGEKAASVTSPSTNGSKYPEKRAHPQGRTCDHDEVLVEQYNQSTHKGYWVCGKTKRYGGPDSCKVRPSEDAYNISDPSKS